MPGSAFQKMSEADYLRTEESSPFKREYIDGFVYGLHADDSPNALAGGLSKHGVICANLIAALHRPALQQGCRVYASDMRVRLQAMGTHSYYLDVLPTCPGMPAVCA